MEITITLNDILTLIGTTCFIVTSMMMMKMIKRNTQMILDGVDRDIEQVERLDKLGRLNKTAFREIGKQGLDIIDALKTQEKINKETTEEIEMLKKGMTILFIETGAGGIIKKVDIEEHIDRDIEDILNEIRKQNDE